MSFFGSLEPKYDDNAQLTRDDYNALVQGAQRQTFGNSGFSDGYTNFGEYEKSFPVPFDIVAKSLVAIPIYSICTLKLNPGATNVYAPFQIGIQSCRKLDPRPLLFTNSESECIANGTCVVHPISYLYPVILKSAAGEVPVVGAPCGPAEEDFYVSKYGSGLICLAVDATKYLIMAYLDMPGRRWLVKPETDIATNTGGDVNVWTGEEGQETLSSPLIKFPAWNRTSTICKADKFAEVVEIDGKRYAVPWECDTAAPPVNPAVDVVVTTIDDFTRTVGNNINVGAPVTYTHYGAGTIDNFMVVQRDGAVNACQLSSALSGVIMDRDFVSYLTKKYTAEIELYGLKNGDSVVLWVSFLDANNYYEAHVTMGSTSVDVIISKMVAGVQTQIGAETIQKGTANRVWIATMVDVQNDFIYAYLRDENLVKSSIIQAPYINNQGSRCGFGAGAMNGTNDVDNFKVEETHAGVSTTRLAMPSRMKI